MVISQDIRFTDEQQQQLQKEKNDEVYDTNQFCLFKRQLADKITNYASLDELRTLLVCGAQPNGEVTRGLTPLHYACFINNLGAAKLLLAKGANVDAVDDIGCSALHLCAEHGYYRMIQLLLQYTESVQQYETPVMNENGKYPSRENIDEPLRLAIKNGHYECARLLLENGACPNAIYFDGPEITHVSPLDINFLELLLKFGANPNVFDRKGLTPIMKACRLKENGIEAIRILHKYGGDVNANADLRQDLRTPMHYAVLSGSIKLIKFLIELGANTAMMKGYNKPSVIDIAVLKDDPILLKMIIDAGADVNAVHTYIGSALHLAACSVLQHQYEILSILLASGADPNMQHQFNDGSQLKSPFVEYFRSRDVVDARVVYLFLSYGARVVMRSPVKDTRGQLRNMLRLAATRNQPQVLSAMLELGEDYDVCAIDRLPLPITLKGELLTRAKNPASLQQICRLNLRSTISPFRPDVVSLLSIPTHMKDYVLGISH
ncbi:ankyrin repeat protein [Dictyocaulus viviparus]|uniref:Ankyrin repeat protein n=1 Tax=Dictyocaulus viviparus TaxID=29172 RepID=A0A0D8XZ54_DICVI|nr:ankyrin repeat protein [Dictyocaulus viviparus]